MESRIFITKPPVPMDQVGLELDVFISKCCPQFRFSVTDDGRIPGECPLIANKVRVELPRVDSL